MYFTYYYVIIYLCIKVTVCISNVPHSFFFLVCNFMRKNIEKDMFFSLKFCRIFFPWKWKIPMEVSIPGIKASSIFWKSIIPRSWTFNLSQDSFFEFSATHTSFFIYCDCIAVDNVLSKCCKELRPLPSFFYAICFRMLLLIVSKWVNSSYWCT